MLMLQGMRGFFKNCLWNPRASTCWHDTCPGGGIERSQIPLPLFPETFGPLEVKTAIFEIINTHFFGSGMRCLSIVITRWLDIFFQNDSQGHINTQEMFIISRKQHLYKLKFLSGLGICCPPWSFPPGNNIRLFNSLLDYRDPVRDSYISVSVLQMHLFFDPLNALLGIYPTNIPVSIRTYQISHCNIAHKIKWLKTNQMMFPTGDVLKKIMLHLFHGNYKKSEESMCW